VAKVGDNVLMADISHRFGSRDRQAIILAVAIIALYVVVPQFGSFRHSIALIPSANITSLLLAVLCTVSSYFAAAGTYAALALHRLRYGRTLLIQVAGMFINRLLPAGIGGMGVNFAYLKRSRHSSAQAISVVAVNNTLGVIGNLLLLAVVLLVTRTKLPPLHWHLPSDNFALFLAIICCTAALLIAVYWYYRRRLRKGLLSFLRQVSLYRHRPGHLLAALACSMALTLANVMSLWFCALALHTHISLGSVLIIFSFGVMLGTATPTPGGLGGVEAGLVAGFVVYNVDSATALAIALVYRLISYWLPIIAGAAAFAAAQHRKYM
jgi:uncharacterized protein (TIRG00374 family)